MSREVRRVPRDFDAPLNQVWQGYIIPEELYGEPCDYCHGGETWASRWLYLLCFRINMLAEDARAQQQDKPMHPWLASDPYPAGDWLRDENGQPAQWIIARPSEDIIDLIAGIAGCDPAQVGGPFGGSTEHKLYKALVAASGVPGWGSCEHCDGHGEHERYPGQRAEREAWEPTGPPTGDGWQLWSTAGDPMPVSPVFTSEHDFAVWMSTVYKPIGGPLSHEQARRFISVGYTPGSGVITAEGAVPNEHATLLLEGGA